ncbi:threonine transporter RhtB [Streptomyces albospinus]|uniref:Threonine transporter RhtB n=1 Tax=Streptomyces albospinus TaxID=285515 RepID=A0ABQ2V5R1_9ACTN|nr:LysE family translocator [Streptomyces albospinus]GGU70246.1 threonine transporter RhtB [Streptomyces albospinus]
MLTSLLWFAGVAALINVTPGLDTMLVLRTSVAHGRTGGRAAALGILTGCLAWGAATAVGLTALLTASRLAFDTLRIGGAIYLAWLGVSALWTSRRRFAGKTAEDGEGAADGGADAVVAAVAEDGSTDGSPRRGRRAAFRAGVATNLLNPKAGIFYMSLIPQFIPHGASVFGSTLLLTAVDVAELALWYWVVSHAASALGERVRRPSFRRRMEQLSGVAFLGFAANLLLAERA